MQDDTLGVSECGVRTTAMNQFLNTRTNLMNLQFGSDKCKRMHIGKQHESSVCTQLYVDAWKEQVVVKGDGKTVLEDIYIGKNVMERVTEKKYLGDIVSSDGKNTKNITERTNKAHGNVNIK